MTEYASPEPTYSAPLFPGGEYAVDGVLGSGGMAIVYRARDLRRPRTVAIKVLRPDIASLIGTERFLREIAVTSAFTHPHILPLLDSGKTLDEHGRSCLFYVMPLIEGESLASRIFEERRLPLADAVRLTCQILEALRYAHEQGVIHRDIKPANVLLSGGHAVVADFGVARPMSETDSPHGKAITQSGFIVGTPEYMSPEQAIGDANVDERCDLYAVGCVLYEMVVGVPPFDAPTSQQIVSRKLSGTFTAASLMRADVPEALDRILAKALSASPSSRYHSATAFLDDLAQLDMRTSASQARPMWTPAPRFVAPLVIAGVGTALAAGLATLSPRSTSSSADTTTAVALPPTSDKARVAVLPLGTITPDSSLTLVSNALTGDVIDELAKYPALTVISKNGVLPFQGSAARTDSVARVLSVGSIVTGDVRKFGDSITVTMRLIDGETSAQLASVVATDAWRNVLAVRSSLIDSVTSFLRARIGVEIRAVEQRSASNAEAWELLARTRMTDAEELRLRVAPKDERNARLSLFDSLLARASALDPKWGDPVAVRMSFLLLRASFEELALPQSAAIDGDGVRAVQALRRRAVALGDEYLSQNADHAKVRAVRGRARLALWRTARVVAADTIRAAAEADLRRAVQMRRDMADTWIDLNQLWQMTGRYADARNAASEALRADAYLKNPAAVLGGQLFTSLAIGQTAEAQMWCARGQSKYPNDPRFWGCDLTILGWTGRSAADVGRAWMALQRSEARDSANVLASGWGTRRLLVAAVAARAGLADSALAIVAKARANLPAGSTADQVDFGEAHVQSILGNRDRAVALLEQYLGLHPALRGQVRHSPWFTALRGDPRFLAITAPQ